MSNFLDKFPLIRYNITNEKPSNFQTVTDITFRIAFIKDIMSNMSAYFTYELTEMDRPEILAEKVYGNPEAHWIILYANDIYDPFYDWYMNSRDFRNYIVNKYREQSGAATDQGVIEWLKTNYHHYEKKITRTLNGLVESSTVFVVDPEKYVDVSVPYDYYIPGSTSDDTYNLGNGNTLHEYTEMYGISYYDYEDQLNDSKRTIKIIKKEYYPRIAKEFIDLTGVTDDAFIRKLV